MSGSPGAEATPETEAPPAADVIVVAAGSSRRMAGIDKLYAPVAGRPLLAWTLDAIAAARSAERIALVAAADQVGGLRGADWLPPKVVTIVAGGARRQDSVRAGVRALDALGSSGHAAGARVVLVHDGARPLVSPALVDAVATAAARHGAAIPVLPIGETVKRVANGVVAKTVDRSNLATAQTPQGVRRDLLERAFDVLDRQPDLEATDEAGLLEASAIPVHTVPGSATNLKVTLPADLERVEAALRGPAETRVGYGFDRHAFGPGSPLRLGGAEIPGAPQLHGHSDGDAALHAISNAMLSGAGRGDIGRLFPADARTPRNIDSAFLLREARRVTEDAGWRPTAVTVAIEAGRPKLGAHLPAMTAAIAELLSLQPTAVGVSASTGNLSSVEGAGRAIAATAVATLTRILPE